MLLLLLLLVSTGEQIISLWFFIEESVSCAPNRGWFFFSVYIAHTFGFWNTINSASFFRHILYARLLTKNRLSSFQFSSVFDLLEKWEFAIRDFQSFFDENYSLEIFFFHIYLNSFFALIQSQITRKKNGEWFARMVK